MGHEIYESDNVLTVGEKPWDGLGVNIPEAVPPLEAMVMAGLDWEVEKRPVHIQSPIGNLTEVPGHFATVRVDTRRPLGIVGRMYEPYQNKDLFEFLERFCAAASAPLESCGSLRDGRIVWCMAKSGELEYLANDPIERYFMVQNSHDGSSRVELVFTDVRVVCMNTLSAALKGAKNRHAVRHTGDVRSVMDAIASALEAYMAHSAALGHAMVRLVKAPASAVRMAELTRDLVGSRAAETLPEPGGQKDPKACSKILELVEAGAGTSIPGVRGSLYGWVNAVTEYVDHYRPVKAADRGLREARFDTAVNGTGARMKQAAFDLALKAAA